MEVRKIFMRQRRIFSLILAAAFLLSLFCACAPKVDTTDYSQSENWAYYAVGEGKDADLFLILPYGGYG